MTDDRLAQLIARQRELYQRMQSFDITTLTPQERLEHVRVMTLACIDELMEALHETSWKPWATGEHVDEDALFGELRDAWQFLTDLMCLAYPQDDGVKLADRLETALHAKWEVNLRRAAEGYDGRNKCPGCGRALDEPNASCRRTVDYGIWCNQEARYL